MLAASPTLVTKACVRGEWTAEGTVSLHFTKAEQIINHQCLKRLTSRHYVRGETAEQVSEINRLIAPEHLERGLAEIFANKHYSI